MIQYMCSSEVALSKFLGSNDIIQYAYRAILKTSLTYELHTSPSGIKILAFNCSTPDYTTRFLNGEFGLVSSENHKVIDFITTKVNPSFSINKAAVELFEELSDDLKQLENKHFNTPLVITGSGLGGYLAIFSTLRLQRAIDVEESNESTNTKRPICITFGSPLVGDVALQHAISERSQWISSFLNVVAKKDPVASFFTSKTPYKPFGTYLVSTDLGRHSAFENEDAILTVLDAMASTNYGTTEMYDYGKVLSLIKRKVFYRGSSDLGEFNMNTLTAGIELQLKEVGVLDDISYDLAQKLEDKQRKIIEIRKNLYEGSKLQNDMISILVYMEVYMRTRKEKGGYYTCYKNATNREESMYQEEITNQKGTLTRYWKRIVVEKNLIPQKESTNKRRRWLLRGTNYRMMVEPLDIAVYYKMGKKNYIANRPHHYTLLENWLDEDQNNSNPSAAQTNKTSVLTYDSCFWAYVEEAVVSLKDLEEGSSSHCATDITQGLEMFRANLQRTLAVVRSRWINA